MSTMTMCGIIENLGEHEWKVTTHTRKVASFKNRHPRGNMFVFAQSKQSPKSAKAKAKEQVPGYVALQKYGPEEEASPSSEAAATPTTQSSSIPAQVPSRLVNGTAAVSASETKPKIIDGAVIGEIGVVRHQRNKAVWVSSGPYCQRSMQSLS